MPGHRRYKRFSVEGLDIHARTVTSVDVSVVNISLGGISVVSPKRLNIGGKYSLRLCDLDGTMNLQTEVVWEKLSGSRKEENGDVIPVYTAGLRFRDSLAPSVQKLRDYLEDLATVSESRLNGVRLSIKTPEKVTLNLPSAWSVKKLSLGGMLILVDKALEIGENLSLELVFPRQDKPVRIQGSVASCLPIQDESETRFDIGVRFLDMADKDAEQLQKMILNLQEGR